jgi:hypothetical protein
MNRVGGVALSGTRTPSTASSTRGSDVRQAAHVPDPGTPGAINGCFDRLVVLQIGGLAGLGLLTLPHALRRIAIEDGQKAWFGI